MDIESRIKIVERPIPIYPSYRPLFRIAQILLILHFNSRSGKASLLKLHLFSWCMKLPESLKKLEDFALSQTSQSISFFGMEVTLNRALSLAVAQGLINFDRGSYVMTAIGKKYINSIIEEGDILINEIAILKIIGKSITEERVNSLAKNWSHA